MKHEKALGILLLLSRGHYPELQSPSSSSWCRLSTNRRSGLGNAGLLLAGQLLSLSITALLTQIQESLHTLISGRKKCYQSFLDIVILDNHGNLKIISF